MKKLIASKPIQYMGRIYGPGDTLPAYDGKMVSAWLKAGTATWDTGAAPQPQPAPAMDPAVAAALQALDALGVKITDDAGAPCGVEELVERITGAVVPEDTGELIAGHLAADALAKLSTSDLEKLAADMGVDISGAKTNTERAEMIAAVEVLIPKSGSAQ